MKQLRGLLVLSLAVSPGSVALAASTLAPPSKLLCDARVNPLGIDSSAPRFSWVLEPAEKTARGLSQRSYEVIVSASASSSASAPGDEVWDSGRVASAEQYGIAYGGIPLASLTQYTWKVRVWDGGGQPSVWSAPATFVTAFLKPGDWNAGARWIAAPQARAGLAGASWIWHGGDPGNAPLGKRFFRASLEIPAGSRIVSARASLTADSQFELSVNGIALAQGTDWKSVTDLDLAGNLHAGSNAFLIEATNSGDKPRPAGLIVRVEVRLDDGTLRLLVTGDLA